MPNKTTNSICLLLVATALSITGNVYAEIAPANPNALRAQQDGTVTGNVVDAYGPVIGASVIIKGTTTGNITDMDGNFTLEGVKNGDVIPYLRLYRPAHTRFVLHICATKGIERTNILIL